MFGSLFKSAAGLVGEVARIASAPVEIALDVTKAVVKPVADAAEEIAKDVKNAMK